MEIQLGWKVKDKATGLVGIALAKCIYLNGCVQFNVVPPVNNENHTVRNAWIDEQLLEKVSDGLLAVPKVKRSRMTGLPRERHGGGERSHPGD